jgi:geranylgeranyl diphosphate synthase, type II
MLVSEAMAQISDLTLSEIADPLRQRVDRALGDYCTSRGGCPDDLLEAIRYSLLAPGKRLRPILVLMAAEACGTSGDEAMPAACAVEMVHAYSLVHDDLPAMDDDDLRRGQPTCHKKYGEAMAILAGDALLTLAFETLARQIRSPQVAVACCEALARAAGSRGMVGGQADDCMGRLEHGNIETLESIHNRKTGQMIRVSLQLGALVAGADDTRIQALDEYGRRLGLAFQITDDLLDVRGKQATTGKRVGKDSQRGKLTFPGLLGMEESHRRAELLIEQACRAIEAFGRQGHGLEAVARYVLARNR